MKPAELVPALEDQGQILTQSLAIIEYLEESYPRVPLRASNTSDRARIRAITLTILRVL